MIIKKKIGVERITKTIPRDGLRGFTLIELVVVMAITAVLATLVIGAILVARASASRTQNINNAKAVQTAIEADFGKHPRTGYTGIPAGTSFATAMSAYLGGPTLTSVCKKGGGTVSVTAGLTGHYTITPSDVTTAGTCSGNLTVISGP